MSAIAALFISLFAILEAENLVKTGCCLLVDKEEIGSGVAVLNMHAPYEVSSKADVYEAVKGYKAFLANK